MPGTCCSLRKGCHAASMICTMWIWECRTRGYGSTWCSQENRPDRRFHDRRTTLKSFQVRLGKVGSSSGRQFSHNKVRPGWPSAKDDMVCSKNSDQISPRAAVLNRESLYMFVRNGLRISSARHVAAPYPCGSHCSQFRNILMSSVLRRSEKLRASVTD